MHNDVFVYGFGFTATDNVSGMGELHLEVLKTKLERQFNLNVMQGKIQITYRLESAAPYGNFRLQRSRARQLSVFNTPDG